MTIVDETAKAKRPSEARTPTRIVDTDVHEGMPGITSLLPYLPKQWHAHIVEYGFTGPPRPLPYGVPATAGPYRKDLVDLAGGPPASSVELMRRELFDENGIDVAILDGEFVPAAMEAWFEFAGALSCAYNDYLVDTWLSADSRFRGSIRIPTHDPQAAVREIDRMAAHPQMVQVFLPLVVDRQYGDPFYHPIFEAAVRHNLVVAMHHGPFTRSCFGYPRFFAEWHATLPQTLMAQVVSLVFNGVFDLYPDLKVVGLESGFTWVPHLMWRMDQQYRSLRAEVPWVKRLPSDQLRASLRLSTQPYEDLSSDELVTLVGQMGSDRMLVFSSDYPHWDYDSPTSVLPARLPAELRDRIMFANADDTYTLTRS